MKIIKRIFSRYFDFFVALFSTLLVNLVTIYSFIKYGESEFGESEDHWCALLSFCGGEYVFYEQKWGIVVPLLCLIYPLKFIIPLYYFPLLRIVLSFLDLYLVLKVANLIFSSRKVSLIILFFIFSPVFQFLKFLMGKVDPDVFPKSILTIFRIFNPTYFVIFFLLFLYNFFKLLDILEGPESQSKEVKKRKLLSAIFLGLSFYSQTHWVIYTFSTFTFFVVFCFFILKKEKRANLMKEFGQIYLLAFAIGIPSLIFNSYQRIIIGEETLYRLLFLDVKRDKVLLYAAQEPQHIILFLLAIFSFFFRRSFSLKYIFVFSGFFTGYFLFLAEYILGIYMQLNYHVVIPFKLMAKLGVGFFIDKIEKISRSYGKKILNYFTEVILIISFIVFISSSILSLYGYISLRPQNYKNIIENFKKVAEWIKHNTAPSSVITVDGYLIYPDDEHSMDIGRVELRLFLYANRFILYSITNYFSDLSHEEVFYRFILRSKLLGLSSDKIAKYVYNSFEYNPKSKFVYPLETLPGFLFTYFGKPPDFQFSKYENFYEAKDDFVNTVLKYYNDDEYFEYLLKKYKVDYVVRKKPYEGEWYLKEETKIGDFYIFRVIREKS
jgi:hypothetical protein